MFQTSKPAGAGTARPVVARSRTTALPALATALSLLACGVAVAQTETLFVIEQLVVSVNSAADGSGERVGQIQSGDRVEVLAREGEQSQVKLASGTEGWVRSSYLSSTPPLREQLRARNDELDKLRQEKTRLETDLASAKKAVSAATAAASSAANAAAASQTPTPLPVRDAAPPAAAEVVEPAPADTGAMDNAPASNPPLFSADGFMPSRPSWLLALIVAVGALAGGFALGWRMLDRRIRAKYGGLRIY